LDHHITKGTDTAWNVSLQATLLEQNQRIQLPQALSPDRSQVVKLADDAHVLGSQSVALAVEMLPYS
jgi:hypothetical protein